ncbi:MAG: hypothetical protein GXP37_05975 [Chloroflexi bacterium]|nr:hypothetical protein [Chloroflexota bacterium]
MSPKSPTTTYHHLRTVLLEQQGCPICHIGHHAGHAYLDSLLWESVNDPGIRLTLTASLGLCGRHSQDILDFHGERLGVAILQRAMLDEALQQLQELPSASPAGWLRKMRGKKQAARDEPAVSPSCPACQQEHETRQRTLIALVTYYDEALAALLRTAGGLCHPHLLAALSQTNTRPDVRQALIDLHRQLWQDTSQALAEFIRKNDHRFRHEPVTDAERVAIERSIVILTGEIA